MTISDIALTVYTFIALGTFAELLPSDEEKSAFGNIMKALICSPLWPIIIGFKLGMMLKEMEAQDKLRKTSHSVIAPEKH